MKNFYSKTKLLLMLIMFFIALSCTEKFNESIVINTNDVAGKYLILKDNRELHSLLAQLEDGELTGKIEKLTNFYSMWDVYQDIMNSNDQTSMEIIERYPNVARCDDDGMELIVKDPALAKVLNPRGYLQIGKYIIKVDEKTIKAITNGNEQLISKLENAKSSSEDGTILVENIQILGADNFKGTEDYTWSGTVYSSGGEERVQWDKWGRHYALLGYASAGAEIKYQEKKLLGWFAQKRPLYLLVHVYCIGDRYGCWDMYPYDMSASETAKSLTVAKHYPGQSTVETISLQIYFNANGIVATR